MQPPHRLAEHNLDRAGRTGRGRAWARRLVLGRPAGGRHGGYALGWLEPVRVSPDDGMSGVPQGAFDHGEAVWAVEHVSGDDDFGGAAIRVTFSIVKAASLTLSAPTLLQARRPTRSSRLRRDVTGAPDTRRTYIGAACVGSILRRRRESASPAASFQSLDT